MDETEEFLARYQAALDHAEKIVHDHDLRGENLVMPLPSTFPHGPPDLTFMLFNKICRVLGYEENGKLDLVKSEAYDIINYAAFLVALLEEPKDEDLPHPADPSSGGVRGHLPA